MLHFRAAPLSEGYNRIVSPENAPVKYLEFGRVFLRKGCQAFLPPDGKEKAVCILSGRAEVTVTPARGDTVRYQEVGGRANALAAPPTVVFVPRQAGCALVAQSDELHLAVSAASSRKEGKVQLVRPEQVTCARPGASNWSREVYTAIGPNVEADRLLVGETINPPGNWSSYPPHKHDTKGASEAPYEEIYFYLLDPPSGFGLQRIYTAAGDPQPIDEALVIQHGDVVVIPRGYHPVVAAAGYRLYYLWTLAGEERVYGAWSDDPEHAWIKGCEPLLRAE